MYSRIAPGTQYMHISSPSTLSCHQKMHHGKGSSQAKRQDWKCAQIRDKTELECCWGLYYMSAIPFLFKDLSGPYYQVTWHAQVGERSEKYAHGKESTIWEYRFLIGQKSEFGVLWTRSFNHLWGCTNNELRRRPCHFLPLPSNSHSTFVWPFALNAYLAWIMHHSNLNRLAGE